MIFYIMFVFWVGREKYAQILPHFLSIVFLLKLFFLSNFMEDRPDQLSPP